MYSMAILGELNNGQSLITSKKLEVNICFQYNSSYQQTILFSTQEEIGKETYIQIQVAFCDLTMLTI